MHAKLLVKEKDKFIIEVDAELISKLSPVWNSTPCGEELRLHDYVVNAEQFSYARERLRKVVAELFSLNNL